MAEKNNYSNQVVLKDGVQYVQVLLDGTIVNEFPLPTATGSKPTEPTKPAENAEPEEAKTEAPASTEAPATAETTEKKKGLSAKAKKGLAIAGGVVGGAICYLLGERHGHDTGAAEGYQSGYYDANSAAASTTDEATDQTWVEASE